MYHKIEGFETDSHHIEQLHADIFIPPPLASRQVLNLDAVVIPESEPALGTLLMASLTAATTVLVPMTADRYAAQGISRLARSIADTQKYTN